MVKYVHANERLVFAGLLNGALHAKETACYIAGMHAKALEAL